VFPRADGGVNEGESTRREPAADRRLDCRLATATDFPRRDRHRESLAPMRTHDRKRKATFGASSRSGERLAETSAACGMEKSRISAIADFEDVAERGKSGPTSFEMDGASVCARKAMPMPGISNARNRPDAGLPRYSQR
jgi:hypothetical protein